MPHYGLMCRSLRDTAFFAKYASSSVDEYAGFPNALAVTRALNAIQDAAECHLDVYIAEVATPTRRRAPRGIITTFRTIACLV
eukprot:191874-Pleurochrysis_carterae.AAC.1